MSQQSNRKSRKRNRKQYRRGVLFQTLESRRLLASDWQNAIRPADVNSSGDVSALDALVIINELNRRSFSDDAGVLEQREGNNAAPFFDVNEDELVTVLDALLVINLLNRGNAPPEVTFDLASDTGVAGDFKTSSIQLVGSVFDANNPIASVEVSVGGGEASFAVLDNDGTFSFDPGLPTDGSADGPLTFSVTAFDVQGASSQPQLLSVVYDTQAPLSPSAVLDPAFDTAPLGDASTTLNSIRIVGATSPFTSVSITELNADTQSDDTGGFAFENVPLDAGVNRFELVATDAAGNMTQRSLSITRGTPVGSLAVQLDDSSARIINQNISFTGSVAGSGLLDSLLVQTDLGNAVEIGNASTFSYSTDFALDGSADGNHVIRFRAIDSEGNLSPLVSVPVTSPYTTLSRTNSRNSAANRASLG